MKVKELIEELLQFDMNSDVVVNGYEGGCNEPSSIEEISIMLNKYKGSDYYGNHEEIEEWHSDTTALSEFIADGGQVSKAVIIRR